MTRPSSSMHAEACPWCDNKHAGLHFYRTKPDIWVVACPRCGAVGPHPEEGSQSYTEAIGRWNGQEQPLCNAG